MKNNITSDKKFIEENKRRWALIKLNIAEQYKKLHEWPTFSDELAEYPIGPTGRRETTLKEVRTRAGSRHVLAEQYPLCKFYVWSARAYN